MKWFIIYSVDSSCIIIYNCIGLFLESKGATEFSVYELPQRSYEWGDFAKAAFVSLKRMFKIDIKL